MKLFELYDKSIAGYQDLEDDHSKPEWRDLRKTKLTLRQIRKLRKMQDVRAFEKAVNLKKVRKQYKPAEQPQM